MTDLLTAAKEALEALDSSCRTEEIDLREDLRTAITEAEKSEPVAWYVPERCKDDPTDYPFTQNPAFAERYNGTPLYLHPAPATPGWIRAVDEELVVCCIGIAESSDDYETARKKLHELIQWHIDVATNPAVNGGYKLIAREPTHEMLRAGYREESTNIYRTYETIYQAMWDAAPEVKR